MNRVVKFRKPTSPAFLPGEKWKGSGTTCEIVAVTKFGDGKWDYFVFYRQYSGTIYYKDAWNFQLRYEHVSDHIDRTSKMK